MNPLYALRALPTKCSRSLSSANIPTAFRPLSELQELGATSVTRDCLSQIKALNGDYKAVVEENRSALSEAKKMESIDEPKSPLSGIPFTVKDTLTVKGFKTTLAQKSLTRGLAGSMFKNPRKQDGDVVRLLRKAGAVFVGKTNIPEKGLDVQTFNNYFPSPCVNPWDNSLTPGGSSGGGAVSVATGMAPLAIGTDLAGSIRIPAAFTGICSVRATSTLVPCGGHIPPIPEDCSSSIVVSAMAKRIDTLDAFLEVASSEHHEKPYKRIPTTLPSSLRVAMTPSPWNIPIDPRQKIHLEGKVKSQLEESGVTVDIVDGPTIDAKMVGKSYFAFARRYFIEHISASGCADPFTGKMSKQPCMKECARFVEELRMYVFIGISNLFFFSYFLQKKKNRI